MRFLRISSAAAAVAVVLVSCTRIDSAADRPTDADGAPDAADDVAEADSPPSRCRQNASYFFASDAGGAVIAGDVPPSQVVEIGHAAIETREAGIETVSYLFYLAGDPVRFPPAGVVDLASPTNADLATCAYCGVAYTNCQRVGGDVVCDAEYRAVAGRVRAVRVPVGSGAYWLDVEGLELARVTKREGLRVDALDRDDCMFTARLAFIGDAVTGRRPCPPSLDIFCALADTASRRNP